MNGSCCRSARGPLGIAAIGGLLTLLVPKCPICLAMYLSFLGAAATGVAWLRPLGAALLVAGLAVAAGRLLARSFPVRSASNSSRSNHTNSKG